MELHKFRTDFKSRMRTKAGLTGINKKIPMNLFITLLTEYLMFFFVYREKCLAHNRINMVNSSLKKLKAVDLEF